MLYAMHCGANVGSCDPFSRATDSLLTQPKQQANAHHENCARDCERVYRTLCSVLTLLVIVTHVVSNHVAKIQQ